MRRVLAGLAILAFAGCGGGGGGGASMQGGSSGSAPSTSPPPAPPTYTFAPAVIAADYYVGAKASVRMSAKANVPVPATVFLTAEADNAPIESVTITPSPNGDAEIVANMRSNAAAGHYQGSATVSVCSDSKCANPLPGSPFKLPYDIYVVPEIGGVFTSNLKTLSELPGGVDWETAGGNAGHTGYIPVTLNAAALGVRWRWFTVDIFGAGGGLSISALANGGGKVYFRDAGWLNAVNESDGSRAWNSNSSQSAATSPVEGPAYHGGTVYTAAADGYAQSLHAYATDDGHLLGSAFFDRGAYYGSPVVVNDSLYLAFGGVLNIANATTLGEEAISGLITPEYTWTRDFWFPAVVGDRAYGYAGGTLFIMDAATAKVQKTIQFSDAERTPPAYRTAPIVGDDSLVFAKANNSDQSVSLVAFDTAAGKVRWSVTTPLDVKCAYADRQLLCLNFGLRKLDVRSAATGEIAWSWTAPAEPGALQDLLVTKNMILVSGGRSTYAVDRTTHAQVARIEPGGQLSLTRHGTLLIHSNTADVAHQAAVSITAFNTH